MYVGQGDAWGAAHPASLQVHSKYLHSSPNAAKGVLRQMLHLLGAEIFGVLSTSACTCAGWTKEEQKHADAVCCNC